MNRTRDALIWGIILLLVGLAFLLWNFGVFASVSGVAELVIAGLFALAGVGFLAAYLVKQQEWWRVIPGFLLLAVGGIVFLATRGAADFWLGAVLLVGLALAFAVIYFSDRRERWWALVPGGALVVTVIVVLLSNNNLSQAYLGAVLFGGLGLVFLLIYALAPERPKLRWSLIPAGVLLVMGLVSLAAGVRQANPAAEQWVRLWPILLIGLGVLLLGFAITRSGKPAPPVVALPPEPAPTEAVAAPGTGIYEVPEAPVRFERAPITLIEPQAGQPTAPAQSGAGEAGDETPDIYAFLQSAPPTDK